MLGLRKARDVAKTARAAELAGGLGPGGTITSKMGQAATVGALEGGLYGLGAGGDERGRLLAKASLAVVSQALLVLG